MKKTIISVSSSLFLCFVGAVGAAEKNHDHHNHGHKHGHESKKVAKHSAHEHGVAKMNIAVIGKEVQIELDSPAYNLVGFEHQPKSSSQKKIIKKAEKALAKPEKLITVANNSCVVEHVKVDSPFVGHKGHDHNGHHDHGKHEKHEKHAEEKEVHSEYALEYHLICDSVEINKVDFSGLFKKFSNFSEVRVQWLSKEKQGDAELSSANTVVTIQ